MDDNFNFNLVDSFLGYISATEKTNVDPRALISGSMNVYKKISGNIASRFGLKVRGASDATAAGVVASYTWNTSFNLTRPMRVTANGNLQVESKIVDGVTPVWYSLLTGLTKTRYVMDPFYQVSEAKDSLLMVDGTPTLRNWSGGIGAIGATSSQSLIFSDAGGLLLSFAITTSDPTLIAEDYNGLIGANIAQGTISLLGQPLAGDTITMTMSDGSISTTAVVITFVSVIGSTPGNVLIGANAAATFANLLNLLQHPSTSNANQVAFTTNGAALVAHLTVVQAYGISLSGSGTWAQSGFSTNKSNANLRQVVINGNTYTYAGGYNTSLLVVTTNPAGEATGSVVIQTVVSFTNIPAVGFNNDFIKVIGNRAHVGSYSSRLIYISSSSDYSNYTVPTPRTPGSPELLTLDNTAKGIGVRIGNANISAGTSDWYEIEYENITVGTTLTQQTNVIKKPIASRGAALAHEFIDSQGDNVVYMDQEHQVRIIGSFKNLDTAQFPSISLQIQDELTAVDFTGGALKSIGEIVYITAPLSGVDYMYQTRQTASSQTEIVSERLWHPPQVRSVSRFEVIDGVVYGHSAANPMIYQIWDTNQWHDDSPSGIPMPYTAVMRMPYRQIVTKTGTRRQGMFQSTKLYVEGYIANGVDLNGYIFTDYQGSTSLQSVNINSVAKPAKFFQAGTGSPLGQSSLGDNPLGTGVMPDASSQNLVPKFRAICDYNGQNCFEQAIQVYSDEVDSRWEITSLGTNMAEVAQQATFLRK